MHNSLGCIKNIHDRVVVVAAAAAATDDDDDRHETILEFDKVFQKKVSAGFLHKLHSQQKVA